MDDDTPPYDLYAMYEFLSSDLVPESCMSVSGLDGFLTAIVVGPEPVPPHEWFPVIWGDGEPAFESGKQKEFVIGMIMSRYHDIAACVATDDETRLDPIFLTGRDGGPQVKDWATGFLDAVALRKPAWLKLARHPEAHVLLEPIVLLADESARGNPDYDWDRIKVEAPQMLVMTVFAIQEFWHAIGVTQRPPPSSAVH